jgi:hypothetical protein
MSVVRVTYPVSHPQIRLLDAAAVALFTAVLAVVSWRLYEHRPPAGSVSADRWAMASFRDAIYYPLLAVRDGVNPSRSPCTRLCCCWCLRPLEHCPSRPAWRPSRP